MMTEAEGLSRDLLLDGRVSLAQPEEGYRAAIDPVFLAAFVPARRGQRVLDAGCGTGAASLCLASRVQGLAIDGIELQAPLVDLARENGAANGMGDDFRPFEGDIANPPDYFGGGGYDHVMANPPYLEASHGHPPANPAKHLANRETGADLAQWVDFCLTQARPKGSISFIHRADRIDQLISCLTPGVGGMVIFPLLPNAQGQKAAKRVLVRGDKGSKAPARMMPGLALHEADGAYTPVAQQVLRQGLGLTI